MRHPRSCCTFAFETMAHRKKQVWQPGGGPTGATCCGALLIIPSAFLSFSFRLPLSLFACLLRLFFLLLFLSSLHLRDSSPPFPFSLSLSLSLSEPFPSSRPYWPLSSGRRDVGAVHVVLHFDERFLLLRDRCLLSVWEHATFRHYRLWRDSWLNGHQRKSFIEYNVMWLKVALKLFHLEKNLVRVQLWLHSVQGICIRSSLENIGRKLVSSHYIWVCYYLFTNYIGDC